MLGSNEECQEARQCLKHLAEHHFKATAHLWCTTVLIGQYCSLFSPPYCCLVLNKENSTLKLELC